MSDQQTIKQEIEGHPVSWYGDVFEILFANLDMEAANNLWKKELSAPSSEKKRNEANEDEE